MSIDAGGLAPMTYNNTTGFPAGGLGAPGAGFGGRAGHTRLNSKRLSVALPPKVNPISEDQVDNPTPRTSRSHLLAGLRTQPKAQAVPASAPYNQTQYQGLSASKWAGQGYSTYDQGMPQTATGAAFDVANQYSMNAGRQMYSLPEQVLAPPSFYDQTEDLDPAMLQQMQMTSLYLAQRQQQLQQQLASLTASAQGMSLNTNLPRGQFGQGQMTPQTPQNMFAQQQFPAPIEVPGQPGVYLVYNANMGGYTYMVDQHAQQQSMSPVQQNAGYFSPPGLDPPTPSVSVTPPTEGLPSKRSFTPPKKAPSPPSTLENVEPLPPPSANAFRRGHSHKKTTSLSINPFNNANDGPKTSSAATFGTERNAIPAGPMTGTFGPGAARSGDHPIRQPRGPPAIEELKAAPTSKHEGSKNFASRQRRRALDSLVKAGSSRRNVSTSRSPVSGGSPVSEAEYSFPDDSSIGSAGSAGSRKMSPIGSEMKEKRGSQGSSDGYFGLSSASSSEGEDGAWKQPPTPATPVDARIGGERKKMMLGVLNAAEKRRSVVL